MDAPRRIQGLKMAPFILFLIGVAFGFGFKVRILIPATFLTAVLTVSIAVVHGQGTLSAALVTVAAVVAIQIGYLVGVAVRAGIDHGVTAARKSIGQPRPSLYEWLNH
jgi:hypothetical protein